MYVQVFLSPVSLFLISYGWKAMTDSWDWLAIACEMVDLDSTAPHQYNFRPDSGSKWR